MTVYVPDAFTDYGQRNGPCMYCEKPVLSRRMCSKHYNRWWRHGHPLIYTKGNMHGSFPQMEDLGEDGTLMDMPKEEFWARVDRRPR